METEKIYDKIKSWYRVLTVPMRNGNIQMDVYSSTLFVLTVPMRNGNLDGTKPLEDLVKETVQIIEML